MKKPEEIAEYCELLEPVFCEELGKDGWFQWDIDPSKRLQIYFSTYKFPPNSIRNFRYWNKDMILSPGYIGMSILAEGFRTGLFISKADCPKSMCDRDILDNIVNYFFESAHIEGTSDYSVWPLLMPYIIDCIDPVELETGSTVLSFTDNSTAVRIYSGGEEIWGRKGKIVKNTEDILMLDAITELHDEYRRN